MSDVRSTTELVPWLLPITDGLVVCKDSSFLAAFEFVGVDADTAGESEVYQVGQAADRLMSLLRDLPVTLWWTVRRERTDDYPGEVMPDPVAQMLDDEHRASFHGQAAYINRHFFSIIWMPERSAAGMFAKVGALMGDGLGLLAAVKTAVQSAVSGKHAFAWKAGEIEQAVNEFEGRLEQIEAVMASVRFRRMRSQALLGLLWAQANPGVRMAPKAWDGESHLDALLPQASISVYRDSLQFSGGGEDVHASVISMKSWPSPLAFGAFNSLVSMPTEMVISHCFRVMNTSDALKHIESVKRTNDLLKYPLKTWVIGSLFKRGEMNESNADPSRAAAAAEAVDAKGELNSGRLMFGHHNLSVVILDTDAGRMEDNTRQMMRLFNSSPFIGAIRESMHALSGWATSLPGQWQECRRWLPISSINLVDMAPLMGVSMGERESEHLTAQLGKRCQALTVLPTDYATPYYFNFHAGALGHTLVVGPSRSGKSIGMNFLISQFRKYGDAARIVIFDKDYSCRIPTLLQGGEHIDLRPGGNIRINPFLLADDPAAVPFLASWVEGLISSRGYVVTAEDARSIHEAVAALAHMDDRSTWRLLSIQTLLPPGLALHLEEWVGAGPLAGYFDNTEDSFAISDFSAIEMGEVMKEPRVARAFMDYAFFRLQRSLEAQRHEGVKVTMVYVEEAWFLLSEPHFAARLKDWLKTFAKLNAFVVLCTQSVEDMLDVPATVFASIRDNVQTYIFLPNARATTETLSAVYRKQLGLRDDLVARIATSVPKQDYIIVKPDVARKVHLFLTRTQVAALRSDIAAQRVFERHYATRRHGWERDYINEVMGV